MSQRGPGLRQHPVARFHQALLGDSSKWLLTDASGVVNTRTDGAGFTDFLTTATAGTFYLTKPLIDFQGGPVGAGSRVIVAQALVREISGSATLDNYLVGWSDNADPTTGGALWDAGGLGNNAGLWRAAERDETSGSFGSSFANTDGHGYYPLLNVSGRSEERATAFLYNGATFQGVRNNGLGNRIFVPTHLMVRVTQAAATIQTHRIGVGFLIYPSIPDLTITPRA